MRFEVRSLLSGAGYVIVDTCWEHKMIGPYRSRRLAEERAAAFEAGEVP